MAINQQLPANLTINDLATAIMGILRRAVDGTVVPIFVDYTNNRIIIGGIVSAGQNAPLQVQSGDIEITTAGKGIILKDDGGSGHTCRVTATYDKDSGNFNLNASTIS